MTPKELGYYFPAEFAPQRAIWLSWPHKEESWPGKIHAIFPPYTQFIKEITKGQHCCINVNNENMKQFAENHLRSAGVDLSMISFYLHPTNDAWCRDHGPAFLVNKDKSKPKVIVNWDYNAWGNKYPPYDLDTTIPIRIGEALGLEVFHPGIVMEGGSVEFNGKGTLMTSTACLLNKNRNPYLNQDQIEKYLIDYYGVEQILWIDEGIVGDDTDGHIDDTVRFINEDTVIAVVEEIKSDENYELLQHNLRQLKTMRLLNDKQLNIIELPMPEFMEYEGQRLPASYANFLIINQSVIVPIFESKNDEKALSIIAEAFPDRDVVGINSKDIIWGLGSFHCLSQQEPL
jgi:agmatine deiminase